MDKIEETLSKAEYVLKEVYLAVLNNMYDNHDKVLALIPKTTKDVYGKDILYIDRISDDVYINRKKELETITVELQITEKALRCCSNSTTVAFVNLLNAECEDSVREATFKQLNLLYEEIKKDCKVDCTDKELRKILFNLDSECIQGIIMEQLTDWKFVENEDGHLFKYNNGIYTATLIKYCNFVIKDKTKGKIIEEVRLLY